MNHMFDKKPSRKLSVWGRRIGLVLIGLAVAGAVVRGANEVRVPRPEIPEAAEEISWYSGVLGFYREVTFRVPEQYPSQRVADFYGAWANRNGWQPVSSQEESWSSFSWTSFVDGSRGSDSHVDQFFAHWASPDRKWSLRVDLRYRRSEKSYPRSAQNVYVFLETFDLIGRPVEQ